MNQEKMQSIATRYGTPLYLYDENTIVSQIQKVKEVLMGLQYQISYAMKANSNPELIQIIQGEGLGMEVATPGEFSYASRASVKPAQMIWNSNGKTQEQIDFFMEQGIGTVNIDSLEEMDLWGTKLVKGLSPCRIQFFLRIDPCIDAKTHPYLSTGLINSKFGIQEHLIPLAIQKAKDLQIPLVGLHTHIGSQIIQTSPLQEIYTRMFALSRQFGFSQVNLGGGWGIPYSGQSLDLSQLSKTLQEYGKDFKITMELGRFIIGESGTYIARVISVKWSGSRHFVVLDGGMNHLIRPALYGAVHPYEFTGDKEEHSDSFDIVGPLCESGDILVKNAKGSLPKVGTLLQIKMAGAYGYSMANNYNATAKPAEVLIGRDGSIREIRSREVV
jgi:diaminopimelate decarboxylase